MNPTEYSYVSLVGPRWFHPSSGWTHMLLGESPRDRLPHVQVAECVSPSNTLMLPSTINTGSYVIEKYSRSNPSHASAPTQSQGLNTGQPEWEHFAHPNMSLTLDVKRSMNSTYESVRLRIIWSNVNKGRDGTLGEAIIGSFKVELILYLFGHLFFHLFDKENKKESDKRGI
jgi:hypothetical protein